MNWHSIETVEGHQQWRAYPDLWLELSITRPLHCYVEADQSGERLDDQYTVALTGSMPRFQYDGAPVTAFILEADTEEHASTLKDAKKIASKFLKWGRPLQIMFLEGKWDEAKKVVKYINDGCGFSLLDLEIDFKNLQFDENDHIITT